MMKTSGKKCSDLFPSLKSHLLLVKRNTWTYSTLTVTGIDAEINHLQGKKVLKRRNMWPGAWRMKKQLASRKREKQL